MSRKRQRKKEGARKSAAVRQLEACFERGDDIGFLELFRRTFPAPGDADGHGAVRTLHDAAITRALNSALASGDLDALTRLLQLGMSPQHGPLARLATAVIAASKGRRQEARAHLDPLVASPAPSLPNELVTALATFLTDDASNATRSELPAELRDVQSFRTKTRPRLKSPAGQDIAAFAKAMKALENRDFQPGPTLLAKLRAALGELRTHFPDDQALTKSFATIAERLSLLERLLEIEQALQREGAMKTPPYRRFPVLSELRPIAEELRAVLVDDTEPTLDAPLKEALRRRWRGVLAELVAHDKALLARVYLAWPKLCESALELGGEDDADPRSAFAMWARVQRLLAEDDPDELTLFLASQAKNEPAAHRLAVLWELELRTHRRSYEAFDSDHMADPVSEPLRRLARMARQIAERIPAEEAVAVARRLREHLLALCDEDPSSADAWRAAEQLLVYLPQDFNLLVVVLVGALDERKTTVVEQTRQRLGELGVVDKFDRDLLRSLFDVAASWPPKGLATALAAVRPCLGEAERDGLESFVVDRLASMTENVLTEINLYLANGELAMAEHLLLCIYADLEGHLSSLGRRPALVALMVCLRCFENHGRNAVKRLTTFLAENAEPEAAFVAFEILVKSDALAPIPHGVRQALVLAANTGLERLDRDWRRWLPILPALFGLADERHCNQAVAFFKTLLNDTSLSTMERNLLSAALEEILNMFRPARPRARGRGKRSRKSTDRSSGAETGKPRGKRQQRRDDDHQQLRFDF